MMKELAVNVKKIIKIEFTARIFHKQIKKVELNAT